MNEKWETELQSCLCVNCLCNPNGPYLYKNGIGMNTKTDSFRLFESQTKRNGTYARSKARTQGGSYSQGERTEGGRRETEDGWAVEVERGRTTSLMSVRRASAAACCMRPVLGASLHQFRVVWVVRASSLCLLS